MTVDSGILAAVDTDELPEGEVVKSIEVLGYASAPFVVQPHQQFRNYVLGVPDFSVGIVHCVFFVKLLGFLQVANCGVVAQNYQIKRISGFDRRPLIDIRRVNQSHLESPVEGSASSNNGKKPAFNKACLNPNNAVPINLLPR
jgi:hypothetical protein